MDPEFRDQYIKRGLQARYSKIAEQYDERMPRDIMARDLTVPASKADVHQLRDEVPEDLDTNKEYLEYFRSLDNRFPNLSNRSSPVIYPHKRHGE